jgi:hypothetical protein
MDHQEVQVWQNIWQMDHQEVPDEVASGSTGSSGANGSGSYRSGGTSGKMDHQEVQDWRKHLSDQQEVQVHGEMDHHAS